MSFVINMVICMVLRFVFRIKCKVFSLISFLGPQRVKWMVFVNETECVYCAVRTGYLSKRDGVCLNTKHSICFPKMFVWLSACVFCVWTSQYVPKTNNILTDSQRKSNKMQQCIKILFHIYMKLNIFRATHRPSSGA